MYTFIIYIHINSKDGTNPPKKPETKMTAFGYEIKGILGESIHSNEGRSSKGPTHQNHVLGKSGSSSTSSSKGKSKTNHSEGGTRKRLDICLQNPSHPSLQFVEGMTAQGIEGKSQTNNYNEGGGAAISTETGHKSHKAAPTRHQPQYHQVDYAESGQDNEGNLPSVSNRTSVPSRLPLLDAIGNESATMLKESPESTSYEEQLEGLMTSSCDLNKNPSEHVSDHLIHHESVSGSTGTDEQERGYEGYEKFPMSNNEHQEMPRHSDPHDNGVREGSTEILGLPENPEKNNPTTELSLR